MGVDNTATYGMDLNPEVKKASENKNNAKSADRQLSVMSQNQVDKLNQMIVAKSKDSNLVIMNLPEPVN